jgi:hypothetical protein
MSASEEFFCYFPPVDIDKRYTYSTIYAQYPTQEDHLVAVGVIAISDHHDDHYILQFFQDEDIKDFFQENIVDNFNSVTEEWLAEMSCKEFKSSHLFFGTPFVLASDSAEKICRKIHDKYEQNGYVIKDDHEKWV